jgi:uncharacterized delta-60 repeat protein
MACLLVALAATGAHARPGDIDQTFGVGGVARSGPALTEDVTGGMAVQTDGKVVTVGTTAYGTTPTSMVVARFTATGQVDQAFGNGGIVTVPLASFAFAKAVTLQRDGKILVAGYAQRPNQTNGVAIVRLNTNGTLDPTFDVDGKVITVLGGQGTSSIAASIAVQSNGRIVIGGSTMLLDGSLAALFVRYLATGKLDRSFSLDGWTTVTGSQIAGCTWEPATVSATAIAIDRAGNIEFAGNAGCFMTESSNTTYMMEGQMSPTGALVSVGAYTFGTEFTTAEAIAVTPKGAVIVGGRDLDGFWDILKLNDPLGQNFQVRYRDPNAFYSEVGAVKVTSDGKIVVAGVGRDASSAPAVVMRLLPTGELDTGFGVGGVVTTPIIGYPSLVVFGGRYTVATNSPSGFSLTRIRGF